jgi:hypothetical protein
MVFECGWKITFKNKYQYPGVFTLKPKTKRHLTNAFWCSSKHSQTPRDLGKSATVHDHTCRVLVCIDWGGRCFEHLLWIVTWLARRTEQFLNCTCVTLAVITVLHGEDICRCNLSVKHKNHSVPYMHLYIFFSLLVVKNSLFKFFRAF